MLILLAIIMLTTACCSQKIDSTVGPLKADRQPYVQPWTGGIPGSGSGVNVFLPKLDIQVSNIDMVYYQGMSTTVVEVTDEKNNDAVARFSTDFNQQPDMDMDLDPKKEYGNKPPKDQEKIPFDLKEDELVIQFTRNGKTYNTKFLGVEKKSSMDLPSKPQ